ncbi:ABC transporter permease [Actinocorallia sp. API 0066]|uniref:ABC transporter permease n=1 Tax=Actinocorallia sp. API 0066 TaxID=2896846 RepID=UPI001E44E1F8|nr:ABC transporter permease [Actinocorallia sp. API 0066]MCD0448891.1 ABC transporter permease [Actinocorallia sp. API 0066]
MQQSRTAAALGGALALLQAVLIIAFAWAPIRTEPRDLPLGVAGPPPAVTQVTEQLEGARPGAFAVTAYPDEAAARAAIEDREVYGALVVGPQGAPHLLVASAAGPAVAQLLTEVALGLSGEAAPDVAVTDVVAGSPDDPRGAGFAAMILPLVMSGLAASALLAFQLSSARDRLIALSVFALGAGLVSTLVSVSWLGILPSSSFWTVAGVDALVSFAVPAAIVGLASVLGPAGFGLGSATMFLLGNPFSGAAGAPELLPEPWGALGQYLPPGAAASLMRSAVYFDGAAATGPLLVLVSFAVAGVTLLLFGGGRKRTTPRHAAADEPVLTV